MDRSSVREGGSAVRRLYANPEDTSPDRHGFRRPYGRPVAAGPRRSVSSMDHRPGGPAAMLIAVIACARCTEPNHPSTRYCGKCGLPLGSMRPDAGAGADALGPYEAPEPADPDAGRALR